MFDFTKMSPEEFAMAEKTGLHLISVSSSDLNIFISDILHKIESQPADKNGVKNSRWAIVTKNNKQKKEVFQKFPATSKTLSPIKCVVLKKTDFIIHAEVFFFSCNSAADYRQAICMEFTGAWLYGAKNKKTISAFISRVGRFPYIWQGGPLWSGVILSNAAGADNGKG